MPAEHCELKDCAMFFHKGGYCMGAVKIDKYGEVLCYDPNRSTKIIHEQFDIPPARKSHRGVLK